MHHCNIISIITIFTISSTLLLLYLGFFLLLIHFHLSFVFLSYLMITLHTWGLQLSWGSLVAFYSMIIIVLIIILIHCLLFGYILLIWQIKNVMFLPCPSESFLVWTNRSHIVCLFWSIQVYEQFQRTEECSITTEFESAFKVPFDCIVSQDPYAGIWQSMFMYIGSKNYYILKHSQLLRLFWSVIRSVTSESTAMAA